VTATVNDVVVVSIAATLPLGKDQPSVVLSVVSLAISTQIQSELPSTNDSSIPEAHKSFRSHLQPKITSYKKLPAVSNVAANKVSATTVKWANNLTMKTLLLVLVDILPPRMVLCTPKVGDTVR